jgi:hypothetical protein
MAGIMQWLSVNWQVGFIVTFIIVLIFYLVRVSLCYSILNKKEIKSGGIFIPIIGVLWFIIVFIKNGFYTEVVETQQKSK